MTISSIDPEIVRDGVEVFSYVYSSTYNSLMFQSLNATAIMQVTRYLNAFGVIALRSTMSMHRDFLCELCPALLIGTFPISC